MKIIVPLAEGFEEIEGVTIVDILRRARLDVTTAYLGKNPVTGSHGIKVTADSMLSDLDPDAFDAIVLPGGQPGSENLKNDADVVRFVRELNAKGMHVAAICAAPIVLGHAGVLKGRKATCYPGYELELQGAETSEDPVVVDGTIITGRGAGCAVPFALELVGIFKGSELKESLKKNLQVYWNL